MVRICHNAEGYSLAAETPADATTLFAPLHRLFLRSNLKAQLQPDAGAWAVPLGESESGTLQRLVRHLTKYGLTFELDEKCTAILDAVKTAQRNYERILREGLRARKELASHVYERLREALQPVFIRELTPLQLHALHHLLKVGHGANFSVPGSGKTAIALAYFHILRAQQQVSSLLVIGPGSCFEPWEYEYFECFGKKPKSVRLAGRSREDRKAEYLIAEHYEVLLTTYHSAARDVQDLIRVLQRRSYLVVLDESHYVKRPQGGTLAETVLRLAPYAKRRVILTGTPMPNGLPDLWSQFSFLWYDRLPLGRVDSYLRNIQSQGKDSALSKTKRAVAPLFFRITKRQLGLPRPSFHLTHCPMSPLQARIYTGVAARFLSQAKEAPQDREALREWRRARAVRLLQIASNPALLRAACSEFQLPPLEMSGVPLREAVEHYAQYELPSKILRACSLVRTICANGRKAIVWSTFVLNLKMVAGLLKDLSPVVVHGGIPLLSVTEDENRERLIHSFKTSPHHLVLVANPAACAESISLHRACHDAVYLDRSFNCAHYIQSLDRIHRLGLKPEEQTSYHLILADGSIDETVHLRLKEKMRNMRMIVEGDLPGELPGYWSEDLGDQEDRDFALVEQHIESVVRQHDGKA